MRVLINIIKGIIDLFMTFTQWLHIHWLRIFILKLYGMKIGQGTTCYRNLDIRKPKNISIGCNCVINKKVLLDGRGAVLNIGNNVDIAQEAILWTRTHDINSDSHAGYSQPVNIEDYAWIGARSMIMPGVTVHKGAIVAAGAIVTKDVPERTVVAGVPAREIGIRKNALAYTLKDFNYFQ